MKNIEIRTQNLRDQSWEKLRELEKYLISFHLIPTLIINLEQEYLILEIQENLLNPGCLIAIANFVADNPEIQIYPKHLDNKKF